jgi:hypothetical protein
MHKTLSLWVIFMCVGLTAPHAEEPPISNELFNRYHPSCVKASSTGEIWTASYDLNGGVHLKNHTAGRDLVVNTGKESVTRGLAMDVQGEHAYVVWREKVFGYKKLFLSATHDGGMTLAEPIVLDDNTTEALTRIEIGSSPEGNVYVTWYGEKGGVYHVYTVSSSDFGRTFSEVTLLTGDYNRSIYFGMLVDGDNAYVYSYSRKPDDLKYYMVFRKTEDAGKTLGRVSLFIEPVEVKGRLHVFWFNFVDGVPLLEQAYSDDRGETWTSRVFEDLREFDLGMLDVACDQKGNLYMVVSGRWTEKEKERCYFMRSDDNGTTWHEKTDLWHYPFKNVKANDPHVLAGDDGEVVAVWVDYRNIRRNLYMQYSTDSGATWQKKDIPLEEPGKYNTGHFPYTQSLVRGKDRYYVLAYRFPSDITLGEAELLLIDFKVKDRGAE